MTLVDDGKPYLGMEDADRPDVRELERAANSIRPSWAPVAHPRTTPLEQESRGALLEAAQIVERVRLRRRRIACYGGYGALAALLGLSLSQLLAAPSVSREPPHTGENGALPLPAASPAPPSAHASIVPAGAVETLARVQTPGDTEQQQGTAPVRHRLRIRTEPVDALLRLDGDPVPNPFDGEVEGARQLVIEAEAARHHPLRTRIRADRDRTLGLSLRQQR